MRALVATLLYVAACIPGLAHGVKTRTIEVVHPWTYGTSVAGGEVEVYARIKNIGRSVDRLIRVETRLAASAGLLGPAGPAGEAPGPIRAIELVAGGVVELERSGRRIVLRGFTKAQAPYDTFPLTLVFERAGRIEVEVLVEER